MYRTAIMLHAHRKTVTTTTTTKKARIVPLRVVNVVHGGRHVVLRDECNARVINIYQAGRHGRRCPLMRLPCDRRVLRTNRKTTTRRRRDRSSTNRGRSSAVYSTPCRSDMKTRGRRRGPSSSTKSSVRGVRRRVRGGDACFANCEIQSQRTTNDEDQHDDDYRRNDTAFTTRCCAARSRGTAITGVVRVTRGCMHRRGRIHFQFHMVRDGRRRNHRRTVRRHDGRRGMVETAASKTEPRSSDDVIVRLSDHIRGVDILVVYISLRNPRHGVDGTVDTLVTIGGCFLLLMIVGNLSFFS